MPRIRTIKPDFYSDPNLGRLTLEARYFYQSLWVFSDDHGRAAGDPRLLKSQSFPFDDRISVKKVTKLIDELEQAGKVMRYEADGLPYLYLPNFRKHQRIDKPQDPKHPDPFPDGSENVPDQDQDSSTQERKGGERKGFEPPLPPQGGQKPASPGTPRANGTNPRAVAKRREAASLQEQISSCPDCSDKPWTCPRCESKYRQIRELVDA